MLERYAPARARSLWTGAAIAGLLLSLLPLLFGVSADAAVKIILGPMHFAVAAVVIPFMPGGGTLLRRPRTHGGS